MVWRQLARCVGNHSRTALVWAMVPLAVFNGRAFTGCGCTGHFETVCHCQCGSGPCCVQESMQTQTCRANESSDHRTSGQSTPPSSQAGAHGHHCTRIVAYVVVPATVAPSSADHDSHASALALAALDQPLPSVSIHAGQVVQLDTRPPPNDLVITLDRLII